MGKLDSGAPQNATRKDDSSRGDTGASRGLRAHHNVLGDALMKQHGLTEISWTQMMGGGVTLARDIGRSIYLPS